MLVRDAQCDEIHVLGSSISIGYLVKRLFILSFFHVYCFRSSDINTALQISEPEVIKAVLVMLARGTEARKYGHMS